MPEREQEPEPQPEDVVVAMRTKVGTYGRAIFGGPNDGRRNADFVMVQMRTIPYEAATSGRPAPETTINLGLAPSDALKLAEALRQAAEATQVR